MKHIRLTSVLVCIIAAATVTACGSSGSGGSSSAKSSGGLKGSPLKIGWINPGTGTGNVFPYATRGADAAVKYINNELGGLDGHPIQLIKCESDGSPEGDGKCGQEVVAKKPLILSMAQVFNMSGIYQALKPTKIPLIGANPTGPEDTTATNAIWLTGGAPGYLAQQGAWMDDNLHPKTVGIIYDNPAAAAGLGLLTADLKKSGAQITSKLADPKQSDWLGTWNAVTKNKPDLVIGLLGSESACIGIAKARQSQQSNVQMFMTDTCIGQNVFKAVGSALNGTIIGGNNTERKTTTPTKEFSAFAKSYPKYTDGKEDAKSTVAFSTIMTVYLAMKNAAKADGGVKTLTGDKVFKYMKSTPGPIFMGGKYDCSTAPKGQPSICVDNFFDLQIKSPGVLAYAKNGNLYHYDAAGHRSDPTQ